MKRILVTGGLGFLGSALVRRLVADGHRVRVIDDLSRGNERRQVEGAEYINADVRGTDTEHFEVDTIWHLAAINGTRHFYERPDEVLSVQIEGTQRVLAAAEWCGVKDLVLFSSSEVYGQADQIPTPESAPYTIANPLNPRFSYAAGKIAAEMMCLHAPHLDRVTVIRPHNCYGPDMGDDHAIPELIRRLHQTRGRGTIEVENPFHTRAFCYVDDFIDGAIMAWQKGDARGVYHVGTQREIAIGDLAIMLSELMGTRRLAVVDKRGAQGGPSRRCPDTRKLRELGWLPRVTLEEGLKRTVGWHSERIAASEAAP